MMELIEYKQLYYNFQLATSQTRLISLSAGEVLQDFPKRLPKDTKNTLVEMFKGVMTELERAMGEKSNVTETNLNQQSKKRLDTPFFLPALNLYISVALANKDQKHMSFDNLLYAQELVMLFAHLDAFMSDSVRIMCKKEPRLLHRDKKMSWKTILESANWDNIFEKMVEEFSYDFGWKSVKEKVQYLQSEHGLSITTPLRDLDELDSAEKIRHIVIHNGNRVSQEYLDRTRRTDVKVGDIIPLTADYVESINDKVRYLGSDIFISIAEKFFQASGNDFGGVWRREKPRIG